MLTSQFNCDWSSTLTEAEAESLKGWGSLDAGRTYPYTTDTVATYLILL